MQFCGEFAGRREHGGYLSGLNTTPEAM